MLTQKKKNKNRVLTNRLTLYVLHEGDGFPKDYLTKPVFTLLFSYRVGRWRLTHTGPKLVFTARAFQKDCLKIQYMYE